MRSQQQRTQGRSACGGAVQSGGHGVLLVNILQGQLARLVCMLHAVLRPRHGLPVC